MPVWPVRQTRRDGGRDSRVQPSGARPENGAPRRVCTAVTCLRHLAGDGPLGAHALRPSLRLARAPLATPAPQQDDSRREPRPSAVPLSDALCSGSALQSVSGAPEAGTAGGTAPPALGGPASHRKLPASTEPAAGASPGEPGLSPQPPSRPAGRVPATGAPQRPVAASRGRAAACHARVSGRGQVPPAGGRAPPPWVPASGSAGRARARGSRPALLTEAVPAGPVISSHDTVPGSPTVLLLLFLKITGVSIGNEGREWGRRDVRQLAAPEAARAGPGPVRSPRRSSGRRREARAAP